MTSSKASTTSTVLAREARRDRAEPGQIEAEEAARKNEIVAQEIEAAKQALVVGDQRLVFVEADLAQHFVAAPDDDGIAEGVEKAEIDASAMREHLFVERDRVGFMAEQCERAESLTRHVEKRSSGRVSASLSAGSSSRRGAARTLSCKRRPAAHSTPSGRPRACSGPALVKYSARAISNGQSVIGAVSLKRQAMLRSSSR